MQFNIHNAARKAALFLIATPLFAGGGGRLAVTQAMYSLSQELSGPLVYSASLILIVASAISWWRHHHDTSATGQALMGGAFITGIALGAPTLLSFFPGVSAGVI